MEMNAIQEFKLKFTFVFSVRWNLINKEYCKHGKYIAYLTVKNSKLFLKHQGINIFTLKELRWIKSVCKAQIDTLK